MTQINALHQNIITFMIIFFSIINDSRCLLITASNATCDNEHLSEIKPFNYSTANLNSTTDVRWRLDAMLDDTANDTQLVNNHRAPQPLSLDATSNNDNHLDVSSNKTAPPLIELPSRRLYDIQHVPAHVLITSVTGTASIAAAAAASSARAATASRRKQHTNNNNNNNNNATIASDVDDERVIRDANVFSARLLAELDNEARGARNSYSSPFSIYHTLALLLAGANGQTAHELSQLLSPTSAPVFPSYLNDFLQDDQTGNADSRLGSTELALSVGRIASRFAPNLAQCSHEKSKPFLVLANNWLAAAGIDVPSREFEQLTVGGTLMANNSQMVRTKPITVAATRVTRVQTDSTKEALVTVNDWFKDRTCGKVAKVVLSPIDEHNVLLPITSAWLSSDWNHVIFRRVASQVRARPHVTRGQVVVWPSLSENQFALDISKIDEDDNSNNEHIISDSRQLMEFVDETRQSHFVEFIESQPSPHVRSVRFESKVARSLTFEAVEVPLGHQMSFVAVMPRLNSDLSPAGGRLTRYIAALASAPRASLAELFTALDERNSSYTRVDMPVMQFKTDHHMSAVLSKLGLSAIFDRHSANLNGLRGSDNATISLFLNDLLHTTALNIDESGLSFDPVIHTLAARRHNVSAQRTGQQLNKAETNVTSVRLDSPFVYFLRERASQLIISAGCVRDPSTLM